MRSILVVLLCLVALHEVAGAANPAVVPVTTTPDMRFVVVRSTMASCEPNCPEWIEGQGQITAGTPAKLNIILANKANRNLPILLNSNGGDIKAALDKLKGYSSSTSDTAQPNVAKLAPKKSSQRIRKQGV